MLAGVGRATAWSRCREGIELKASKPKPMKFLQWLRACLHMFAGTCYNHVLAEVLRAENLAGVNCRELRAGRV